MEYVGTTNGIPEWDLWNTSGIPARLCSTREPPKRPCEPKQARTFDEAPGTFDEFGINSADHILGKLITTPAPATTHTPTKQTPMYPACLAVLWNSCGIPMVCL